MRNFLKRILRKPVSKLADRYASRPDKELVHTALTALYKNILTNPGKKGLIIPLPESGRFIIFSDHHKGAKDGSDDFSFAERNYIAALAYYEEQEFYLISLGDSEELWENNILAVKKHNTKSFESEKHFLNRNAFIKIFGNHDLYWDNDPLAQVMLEGIYGRTVKIYEAAILQTTANGQPLNIFLTHGHQGDKQSDGNWFSKWFVSNIWAPLQMYLELNLNTPADNVLLKSTHNQFMYDWVAPQRNVLLITGHTHQPIFLSLTFLERLFRRLFVAKQQNNKAEIEDLEAQIKFRKIKEESTTDYSAYYPNYFNTGCCCYNDGDITGIEIEGGYIRLVKWEYNEHDAPTRIVLEQTQIAALI
ncbi:metallophosphoesterase [Pedobacter sp. P351]|uniref:metallophosphoesterase n=1 Tax=Pedobacter superstes TaxID=3133441 RepID=UPI0030A0577B